MKKMLNLTLPGNLRYQPKQLIPYFGYDNLYRTVCEIEIASLQVLGEIGLIPRGVMKRLTPGIIEELNGVRTTNVDKVEREITKHDIRAWVRIAQDIIGKSLAQWVHEFQTSYDKIDTGRSLQYVSVYQHALKPSLKEVVTILADMVERLADQLQIGRTHGQHALPITVGFWLATVLSRILYNAEQMNRYANSLVGKISGAVGASNALVGLEIEEKCGSKSFETRVLEKIGLQPARISTQILPPEPLAYFLYSCCMQTAALGQLGRDCRNLMRSEIGEIVEEFEKGQEGSSAMPHKRNPINFENLEGMFIRTKNEFGKVMDTLISEHQRDLVNSSVARDFPIIVVNLQQQLNTLLRKNKAGVPFLDRLTINVEACEKNFTMNEHLILAEPLKGALKLAGHKGDTYKLINEQLVPIAANKGIVLMEAFVEIAELDDELNEVLSNIPPDVYDLLHKPESYTGNAKEKALEIASLARKQFDIKN